MNNWNKVQISQVISEIDGVSVPQQNILSSESREYYVDRYYQIIKLLPPINKNCSVLDVGLSNGFLSLNIQRCYKLKRLHTLEHPVLYQKYSKRFMKKMSENNITIKPVDLKDNKYPWKDNTFDYIIFSEILEHLIPADVPNVFKEFNRVLKKRGQLIVTTPNIASLLKRLNLSLFGKNPNQLDLRLDHEVTYGHVREYTSDELVELLSSNYNVIRRSYLTLDRKRNMYTMIEYGISLLFPRLSNNIFIVSTNKVEN